MEIKKSNFDRIPNLFFCKSVFRFRFAEPSFVKHQIGVLSVHMGVMSALRRAISHLLLRPHVDVSHLVGASTQTNCAQGAAREGNGQAGGTWPN